MPATDAALPGPSAAPLLSARDLVLGFGSQTVVHGVSIDLRPGAVTALVGPNGSGKSTVLRAMARLHPLTSGAVVVHDRDTGPRPLSTLGRRELARRLTLFTQSRHAPQGLSVREVVAFGRYPYRQRFAAASDDDRRAVDRALALTGLTTMADRAAGALSGGELQRVWLATCLAQETDVVLLDEPTNHLDLRYQTETLDIVRDLADDHGVAVGVVLHDLDHAARVADDLSLLAQGRVLAHGSVHEVLTAELVEEAYGLPVEVSTDPRSHRLRVDPVGRAHRRRPSSNVVPITPSPKDRS